MNPYEAPDYQNHAPLRTELKRQIAWLLTTDFDPTPPPDRKTIRAFILLIVIIVVLGALIHA